MTRPRREDPLVVEAFFFFRNLRRTEHEEGRQRLFQRHLGLFYAWQMYETEEQELPVLVQCRILARETDEQIARRHGTIPDAIRWYEALFFHVRDRLDNQDYITRIILHSSPPRPGGLHEFACKFFAYFGGSQVLDAIVTGWPGRPPSDPAGMEEFFERYLMASIKRRAAMHADWFHINQFNIMQVLELASKVIGEQQDRAAQTITSSDPRQQLLLAMQSMTFSAGPFDPSLKEAPHRPFLESAAEPRPEEWSRILSGQVPEDIVQREFPRREVSSED